MSGRPTGRPRCGTSLRSASARRCWSTCSSRGAPGASPRSGRSPSSPTTPPSSWRCGKTPTMAALSPAPWVPFQPQKLGALAVALLAPTRVWSGALSIALFVGSAVLRWGLFSPAHGRAPRRALGDPGFRDLRGRHLRLPRLHAAQGAADGGGAGRSAISERLSRSCSRCRCSPTRRCRRWSSPARCSPIAARRRRSSHACNARWLACATSTGSWPTTRPRAQRGNGRCRSIPARHPAGRRHPARSAGRRSDRSPARQADAPDGKRPVTRPRGALQTLSMQSWFPGRWVHAEVHRAPVVFVFAAQVLSGHRWRAAPLSSARRPVARRRSRSRA